MKHFLVISAKHAVNAVLVNFGASLLDPEHFHLHSWKGFEHMLWMAVYVIAAREASVWLPKLLKWSQEGLNGNGGIK